MGCEYHPENRTLAGLDLAMVLEAAKEVPVLASAAAEIFGAAAASSKEGADVTTLMERISRRSR